MAKPHKISLHNSARKSAQHGDVEPHSPISPKHPSKQTGSTSHAGKGKKPKASGDPVFAQPKPSPDPTSFKDQVTDSSEPDVAGVQPVPQPATTAAEPVLTLAQVYGSQGPAIVQTIQNAGQIAFHSVGDTGSVTGARNTIPGSGQDGFGLHRSKFG